MKKLVLLVGLVACFANANTILNDSIIEIEQSVENVDGVLSCEVQVVRGTYTDDDGVTVSQCTSFIECDSVEEFMVAEDNDPCWN